VTPKSNSQTGNVHEAAFIYFATDRGWEVYGASVGHDQSADKIVTKPGVKATTVQIKTGTIEADRKGYAISVTRGKGNTKRSYARHDFDVLAVYLPDRKQFAFWTYEQVGGRKTIRYNPDTHFAPGNWDLLNDVAESLTNSGPGTADVPCPTVQMSTSA
jgi:hypothetical protein